MRTTLVSQGSSLIAPVVPLLLCAPKFLDGSMSLGQVMQAASAFTIVQSAFGWLVDNYPRLADWNACARRIASLMMSLDGLERAETGDGFGRIKRGETKGEAMLELNDLSVTLDDGTAVVGETEVVIEPGERLLVAGESGTGKSTLVRALAGLVAMGRRRRQFPSRPAAVHAAAKALRALGHAAPRHRLSRRRETGRTSRSAKPCTRSASITSRRRSAKSAVGPDAVRRREAAPRLCAAVAAQPRHHRAG
jgi:putative ATP-binding cassette transporter